MASTSETGHAVNVGNLQKMIAYVTGYGSKYNPSNDLIKLPALVTLHTAAKASLDALNDRKPTLTDAVNDREQAFEPLSPRITRVVNAAAASSLTSATLADIKTLARKLQGRRATPKSAEEMADSESDQQISTSQLSFDQRIENLDALIKLLAAQRTYAPNEADLSVAGLTTLYDAMTTTNDAAIAARIPVSNARISRNHLLYDTTTGLVDIAATLKKYVLSVYSSTSPEYRQISGLKFTRPRKKKK